MTMLDFTHVPVIDNHSHPFEFEKVTLDEDSLAKVFFHGMGDIPKEGVKKAKLWGMTDELRYHLRHMGVVQLMSTHTWGKEWASSAACWSQGKAAWSKTIRV